MGAYLGIRRIRFQNPSWNRWSPFRVTLDAVIGDRLHINGVQRLAATERQLKVHVEDVHIRIVDVEELDEITHKYHCVEHKHSIMLNRPDLLYSSVVARKHLH